MFPSFLFASICVFRGFLFFGIRHSALSEHPCDPCNPWLILFNPLTLQRFNPGEGIRLLKREHDVGDAVA
ncbi:MAG: hypothetical protein DME76_08810 [Verrucomicrobia bacterium]|nr:MAG: hypothetical protein DME76_08810 [Verrucomicrobiota bacterium]